MPAPYTFADIAPQVAALLNDSVQSVFTTPALLPYAKNAADELQLELELYGILALERISVEIEVPIGTINLGALLPADVLEPQVLAERLSGSTDLFTRMVRRQWEPSVKASDSLRYWAWWSQDIHFVGATTNRTVKIAYLKRGVSITDETTQITVFNSQPFMINRTAGLAARFIGENKERADVLDAFAAKDLDKVISIGVKNKQGTRTRRRPFSLTSRRHWI